MSVLVWSAIFAVVSYVFVSHCQEKYPNLDINPMNYAVGSFCFGALWCMLYLAYKIHEHKKYGKYSK